MAFDATPLLCPFIVVLDIFTPKETSNQHYENVRLNVLDNASLAVYHVTLAKH
jgi:hypothetical protein